MFKYGHVLFFEEKKCKEEMAQNGGGNTYHGFAWRSLLEKVKKSEDSHKTEMTSQSRSIIKKFN